MRRRKVAILCLGIIALLHFTVSAMGNAAQHRLGYERVLKNAASNPFYKYGIYSSRIIAVTNPEVYLQGDMFFAECMIKKGLKVMVINKAIVAGVPGTSG